MTESRLSARLDGFVACDAEISSGGELELPSWDGMFEIDVLVAELEASLCSLMDALLAVVASLRFLFLFLRLLLGILTKREDVEVMIQRRRCSWYSVVQKVCCPRLL